MIFVNIGHTVLGSNYKKLYTGPTLALVLELVLCIVFYSFSCYDYAVFHSSGHPSTSLYVKFQKFVILVALPAGLVKSKDLTIRHFKFYDFSLTLISD
jgi:hypothetical protein